MRVCLGIEFIHRHCTEHILIMKKPQRGNTKKFVKMQSSNDEKGDSDSLKAMRHMSKHAEQVNQHVFCKHIKWRKFAALCSI